MEEDLVRSHAVGFVSHLVKSVRIADLCRAREAVAKGLEES